MSVSYYQSHILRYIQVSRNALRNTHSCPVVVSVHLQAAPLSLSARTLLGTTVLLLSLSGSKPILLIKTSRRTKESVVSGVKLKLRSKQALHFLVALRALSFFYSYNFRGFQENPPNSTQSLSLRHLSFFKGLNRAFDNGLLGFEDDSLLAFMQVSHSSRHVACSALLRALRLPIMPEGV